MSKKDEFFEENNHYGWPDHAQGLIDNMPHYREFINDPVSQYLMETGFFGPANRVERSIAREWIREYWLDHWGYDFYETFDWRGYRELFDTG